MGNLQKECWTFVLDGGMNMSLPFFDFNKKEGKKGLKKLESKLGKVKDVLKEMIVHELMNNQKDIISVVVFGSEETNNELNKQGGGNVYMNVNEIIKGSTLNINMIQSIEENIKENSFIKSDFIDGLVVGLQSLITSFNILDGGGIEKSRRKDGKNTKKKLFIITDGECDEIMGIEDLKIIEKQMHSLEVEFFLIFISNMKNDCGATNEGNLTKGEVKIEEEKKYELQHSSSLDNCRKVKEMSKSKHVLVDFCKNVKGKIYYDIYDFISALRTNKIREKVYNTKCRVNLEITQFFKIPVHIYLKSKTASLPFLKKGFNAAEYDNKNVRKHKNTDGIAEENEYLKENQNYNIKDIRINKEYYVMDDLNMTPVDELNKVMAYKFGKNLLPVSELEIKLLQNNFEKALCLLGVVEMQNIKVQYYLNSCECVIAEPDNKYACKAFLSLINACKNLKCALLCKYISRKNAIPKLVCIHPDFRELKNSSSINSYSNLNFYEKMISCSCPSSIQSCCMYMHCLPFYEDLRFLSFPSFPQSFDLEKMKTIEKLISYKSLILANSSSSFSKSYSSSFSDEHTSTLSAAHEQSFSSSSLLSQVSTIPSTTQASSFLFDKKDFSQSLPICVSSFSEIINAKELLSPYDNYNPTINRFKQLILKKFTNIKSNTSSFSSCFDEELQSGEEEEKKDKKIKSRFHRLTKLLNDLYFIYNVKHRDTLDALKKEKIMDEELCLDLNKCFNVAHDFEKSITLNESFYEEKTN